MLGKVFVDLTVIAFGRKEGGHKYLICLCKCGKQKEIRFHSLLSGKSTSCGDCNYYLKYPILYSTWRHMHSRCNSPTNENYNNYGGRGITVDKRWARFSNFLEDMGQPPTDAVTGVAYTLDRIDVNGNYTKDNCRWASPVEQSNNRRDTIHEAIALTRYKSKYLKTLIRLKDSPTPTDIDS